MPSVMFIDQEGLGDLMLFWYGTPRFHTPMTSQAIRTQWTNVWFAKENLTSIVDKALRERFGDLLEEGANIPRGSDLLRDLSHQPSLLCSLIGRIVLYDQVTRNVHRGTPRAYAYDPLARECVLLVLDGICQGSIPLLFTTVPVQFLPTLVICLCHQEDVGLQERQKQIVSAMDAFEDWHYQFAELIQSLKVISYNHSFRVINFGRIPERNKFVGRINTSEEEVYLMSMSN